jgi:hypothetical protein
MEGKEAERGVGPSSGWIVGYIKGDLLCGLPLFHLR